MSYAIDVNVLLYASDDDSPFALGARDFLNRASRGGEIVYFAWPTLMAYLRISTNPAIFRSPLAPATAMANITALLAWAHVRVLAENEGFWQVYQELATALPIRGDLVPDAHLAALLRQHGVNVLYTKDRDFRKFDFLTTRDPFT